MPQSVRAAVVTDPGGPLAVDEIAAPDLGPGDMLVAVEAATLCGTDVHFWHATASGSPETPYIPGHETAGRVIEMRGERFDVTGRAISTGDRIIWTYPFCGSCYYCSVSGQPTLCVRAKRFGRERADRYPYLLGGCAQVHFVPAGSDVISVPEQLSPALAATAACALRTVMHAFERVGRVEPHETVLVQGCGAVGLFATAVARDIDAGQVLTIGDPPARLAVAENLGADAVCGLDHDPHQRLAWVHDQTGGRGADVVLQCATAAALTESLEMVRPGGRLISIGGGGDATVPAGAFVKTVRLESIRGGQANHYLAAIQYLARGEDQRFEALMGGPYSLDQAGRALEDLAALRVVKPVITPNACT